MNRKVIFLDNDCVICLANNWGRRDKLMQKYLKEFPNTPLKDIPVSHRFDGFDKKAIKVLNGILLFTGADIVVSSDWKKHASLEELQQYYLDQGVSKAPIAFTPNLEDFDSQTNSLFSWKWWYARIRVLEIRKFLEENKDIDSWVAIDDLDLGIEGLENFFLTDPMGKEGIKRSGLANRIIEHLNK